MVDERYQLTLSLQVLKEERQKIRQARWKNVRYLLKNTEAKWILLIPLILYIMTVYMIMHP